MDAKPYHQLNPRILKYIIGIVIVLICLTAFSKPIFKKFVNTDTLVNKLGCHLYEFNTISVKVNSKIDFNKVQIKINKRTVFKEGKQQNRIGQEYGHCILEIYHADCLIAEVGHFKRNNWYTNQYAFEVSKRGTDFIVMCQINGPDSQYNRFQRKYVFDEFRNLIRIDYLNE